MEEMQLKHTGRNAHPLYEAPGVGVRAQVAVLSGQTWGALHLTLGSGNSAPEKLSLRSWI